MINILMVVEVQKRINRERNNKCGTAASQNTQQSVTDQKT